MEYFKILSDKVVRSVAYRWFDTLILWASATSSMHCTQSLLSTASLRSMPGSLAVLPSLQRLQGELGASGVSLSSDRESQVTSRCGFSGGAYNVSKQFGYDL